MNFSFKTLLVLILLIFTSSGIFAFNNMNRQIGILYLKNAAAFYLTGEYERAEKFLEKTREFHDSSSDIEYLYGLIALKRDNDINRAEACMKNAVSNRSWILLEKKDCVTDLARILFRKKEYPALIEMVENEYFPDYSDNDLMYIYLLSMKKMGGNGKYLSALQRSIIRYSDDYRFALLYSEANPSYNMRILKGSYSFSNEEGGRQVFLEAALRIEDGPLKLSSLEKYVSNGGKSTSGLIEYYRLRGGITDKELAELIKSPFFENPADRLRLSAILPSDAMRAKLENAWLTYTGNVYYDFNDDGYFEELHLFENGAPVGISIDEDQDGVIETIILFESGKPSEIIISDDNEVNIVYGSYPEVSEISVAGDRNKRVYTLLKNRLSLESVETRVPDGKIMYMKDRVSKILADTESLNQNSVKVAVYGTGDKNGGYGNLMEEMERRDEYYTILRTYHEANGNFIFRQYDNKKTSGFGDINYDDIIDLKQNYNEGELVSIEADENNNGIYDYKMSFEGDRVISWWDFNEDGLYDCRQYEESGILINEYSSKLNGVFDILERN